MPTLSLTDLVDVVTRSGTPKATKVREIKHRAPYSPATDFYKPFRDGIIDIHRNNQPRGDVKSLSEQTDPKKVANYLALVSGYHKWWGRKTLDWFDPETETWGAHGVDIRVNPELGLQVNGTRHLVKLYLKGSPLAKTRIEVITHLMHESLAPLVPKGTVLSVLDVRNAKLFVPTVPVPAMTATLQAELAYIASLWPHV
jgi:hypothetical protein